MSKTDRDIETILSDLSQLQESLVKGNIYAKEVESLLMLKEMIKEQIQVEDTSHTACTIG